LDGIRFELYSPRHPVLKIPLVTYLVRVPAIVPTERRKDLGIKTEFLLEDIRVPVSVVLQKETFALKTESFKCYSPTALISDKLLTLAEKTIGIPRQEDIPKQIYDITQLSEHYISSQNDIDQIINVMKEIASKEASYRGLHLNVNDVLKDVNQSMEKYSLIDTAGANTNIKKNVTDFQQFYVGASQRKPWYEWSVCALRIRFLAQLLTFLIEDKITTSRVIEAYCATIEASNTLEEISGSIKAQIGGRLMELTDRHIPYYKELRGKPLHRVFWQIVTLDNLDKIRELIQTQIET